MTKIQNPTGSSRTQDPTQREGSIQAMLEKKSSVLYPGMYLSSNPGGCRNCFL